MVIKITRLVFLLFLICFVDVFSQETTIMNLYSNNFSTTNSNNYPFVIDTTIKISGLYNLSPKPNFASAKTQSTKLFFPTNNNSVSHHPLVFAKINFFGINNLENKDDLETPFKEEESSFWDNEIVYFVIGAVAATALYIVWQNSGDENPPQKTFGLPPKPQGAYGL